MASTEGGATAEADGETETMVGVDTERESPVVTVVGSYNVGLTMQVPRFPVPGETIVGQNFAEGAGGKGSNQAIAASRLDGETAFVGRVGTDRYGDDAHELWEREGVDASDVGRDPETHTGAGFVIVDRDGENEITVAPGANAELSAAHVDSAADAIADSDVLLVQLEIGDEPIERAIEVAVEADVDVVLNPAPMREIESHVLAGVDYLTPNQNEARLLAGIDAADDRDDRAVASVLAERVEGTVVMTVGGDGALIVDDEVHAVPAPSVEAIDTTGAGDAFNAAFAVALAEEMTLHDAVSFGCTTGALSVTKSEVIPGLPTRDDVDDFRRRDRNTSS